MVSPSHSEFALLTPSFHPLQNLEHFISSYNALMEHNSRLELQLGLEHPAQDLESAEDVLSRHNMLQDQFKKAPQSAMREANDLLRSLEQVST